MKIPRVLQKIFGSNPSGLNQFGKIGSMAAGTPEYTTDPTEMQSYENFEEGLYGIVLGNKSPAIQDINSLYHLLTRQIAYIFQAGIPEYSDDTEYHIGSRVVYDGDVYRSIINDSIGNLPSLNEVSWINESDEIRSASAASYREALSLAISNPETKTVPSGDWVSIARGAGRYVMVAQTTANKVVSSSDGSTWTVRTPSITGREFSTVKFANNKFFAFAKTNGTATNIMSSSDGETWTNIVSPTPSAGVIPPAWHSIAYGNGVYVAVSIAGTYSKAIMTSSDGVAWVARDSHASSTVGYRGIIFDGTQFIAWGDSATLVKSVDGITWTVASGRNFGTGIGAFAYHAGKQIYVATDYDSFTPLLYSYNLTDWTVCKQTPSYEPLKMIIPYGRGFLAKGFGGDFLVSGDGVTFRYAAFMREINGIGEMIDGYEERIYVTSRLDDGGSLGSTKIARSMKISPY